MNQQWSMLSAMMRGSQIHKLVQHACLCKYGCICKTPPEISDAATYLLCQSVVDYILAQGWTPLSAETPVAGNKRADLVCRDRFGKVKIIEIKSGYKTILNGRGASPRNQRKHLLQACAYGIAWNSSEYRTSVGECDTVLIHYPDTKLKAWFWITAEMWPIFCPPPPPPKPEKEKKPKKARVTWSKGKGNGIGKRKGKGKKKEKNKFVVDEVDDDDGDDEGEEEFEEQVQANQYSRLMLKKK